MARKNVVNVSGRFVSAGGWFFEPSAVVRDVEEEAIPEDVRQLAGGSNPMFQIENAAEEPVVVPDGGSAANAGKAGS